MDGFQERKWFVYQTDHHEGPFSLEEIQAKLSAGQVARTQYVWCEGMGDWQIMTAVRDFEPLIHTGQTLQAPQTAQAEAISPMDSNQDPKSQDFDFGLSLEASPEPSVSVSTPISEEATPAAEASAVAGVNIQLEPEVQAESPVRPVQEVESATQVLDLSPTVELAASPREQTEIHHHERDLGEGFDRNEMPAFDSVSSGPPRSFGFLKVFLTLSIVGLGAYAYKSGRLDPVVKHTGFVKFVTASRGVIQPGLSKLAQWVPALQSIFSPIADIEGVLTEELSEMRLATQGKAPGQIGLSVYRDELLAPTFYVGTNLPNGTMLDLHVVGVSDTLLSQLSLVATAQGSVDQFVARFEGVRQADGRPLVQGQYMVMITEAEDSKQSPESKSLLGSMAPSKMLPIAGSGVTGARKVVFTKSYFLGGPKDDTYAQRLKEFHEKLASKSTDELKEIKQFIITLEEQLKVSNKEYDKAHANKNAKAAAKGWNASHDKWNRLQSGLNEAFSKWTEALTRGDYFHSLLYRVTRSAGEQVALLHTAQHEATTNRPKDAAASSAEIDQKKAAASEALQLANSKLEETQKLPANPSGMPQRLVSETKPEAKPEATPEATPEAAQ